jgi:hypothetical protein
MRDDGVRLTQDMLYNLNVYTELDQAKQMIGAEQTTDDRVILSTVAT